MVADAQLSGSGGSSGGFDPSGLIGTGVGVIGNLLVAIDDAKARRALEEKIAKLTLAQQKELAIRLQDVQGNVAKMQILYQTLALDKNRTALETMNKQKYQGIAILGGSIIALAIVILIVKHKQS